MAGGDGLRAPQRLWLAVLFAAAFLALADARAWAEVAVPPLASRVTDLTGTLDAGQRAELEARLAGFEAAKGSQIAVLLVPTTAPETIEQYSIRVAERWRLGRAGIDDGILLLVALEDRKVRVEVGYGLEGAVPDAVANRIIDEQILPAFRGGDIFGGISLGIDQLVRVVEGEPLPAPQRSPPASDGATLTSILPLLIVFVIVGGGIFRRLFGRVGGALATGGLVSFLTWLLVAVIGLALLAGFIAFIFALGGGGGGGGGWASPRHRGGYGGPFGGGFGGGGGSGGGFGGGGGSFGGGGASGSW